MRRDVRLLGDMLGEVLRESGGQDLLDDVETAAPGGDRGPGQPRSRRAGPAAAGAPDADPAGDEIAALVASWPLDRAELVARAFTVYFHLTNLAEELQRVRALREQDTGQARSASRWRPRSPSSAASRALGISTTCSPGCE